MSRIAPHDGQKLWASETGVTQAGQVGMVTAFHYTGPASQCHRSVSSGLLAADFSRPESGQGMLSEAQTHRHQEGEGGPGIA
jgi:hypothetical protein